MFSLLLALAFASPTPKSNVVGFPLKRSFSKHDVLGRFEKLRKRDNTVSLTLQNEFTIYTCNLLVGTPAQNISVVLDTGSSDLWVMDSSNPYCEGSSSSTVPQNDQIECSDSQVFTASDSSSFSNNNTEFSINYGDGSFASGYWGTDTVSFSGHSIDSTSFGVANQSNSSSCVFGVGPEYGESTVTTIQGSDGTMSPTYENIPMRMKSMGLISSLSYSLWLNSIDAQEGNILFGGVDQGKYSGSLGLVPVLYSTLHSSKPAQPTAFNIMLNGLSLFDNSGTSQNLVSCALPVLLDSGTSLTYLPQEFVDLIAQSIGAQYSQSIQMYVASCSYGGGIGFDFSGVQIQVPISNMMLSLSDSRTGETAVDSNGNGVCALGLYPVSQGVDLSLHYILGDSFLRSAYVVYDMENWEIALANANDSGSEDIVEIISTIPSATSAASYSSTSADTAFDTTTPTFTLTTGSFTGSISGDSRGATNSGQSQRPTTSRQSQGSGSNGSPSNTSSGGASSLELSSWMFGVILFLL